MVSLFTGKNKPNQSNITKGASYYEGYFKYVGLDVSKEKIAVAIADEGRDEPRYWGMIPNTPESIRKLVKKLGEKENLRVCYEARLTGYGLHRLFLTLGIDCEVIAPSLIPKKPGERIKTDRRDSIKLAKKLVEAPLYGKIKCENPRISECALVPCA
ncbi:IS110 family transposase [Neobacillus drentensis]|uniref:IS110 family transposase n=1 Tax=Neobacillus drentensis TaxID=220684 RepID=UPI003B585C5B